MKLRAVLPAALLVGSGIGFAQAQTPEPTPSQMKIDLKLAPGMIRAFKIDVKEKGTMSLPGSGQAMPLDMGMSAYAKLIVDKQNADGTWAARYKIGGMKMLMNGTPVNMPNMTNSFEIKGNVARNGTFIPTEDPSKSAGMMGMGMSPGQTMNNVLGNLMNLPDKPVAVGDAWTTPVPLPFDSTGKSVITVNSKIIGVDSLNGDKIVRIQRDSSGPLNMTLTQPMQMTIKGTATGTGVSKVSLNTGSPVDDASTQHLVLTIKGTNPSGNGEQMNISMDMAIDSHIQSTVLTSDTVKPAPKPAPKAKPKQ